MLETVWIVWIVEQTVLIHANIYPNALYSSGSFGLFWCDLAPPDAFESLRLHLEEILLFLSCKYPLTTPIHVCVHASQQHAHSLHNAPAAFRYEVHLELGLEYNSERG